MNKRTQEKLEEVTALMKKLDLTVSAEERINENGFINKIVFYTDHEKYPEEVKEEKND